MADKERKEQERPYSKPTLTVYGKVIDLTTINSPNGKNNDHAGGPNKTGFS